MMGADILLFTLVCILTVFFFEMEIVFREAFVLGNFKVDRRICGCTKQSVFFLHFSVIFRLRRGVKCSCEVFL